MMEKKMSVLRFTFEELKRLSSGCYRPRREETEEKSRMRLAPWRNNGQADCCTVTVRASEVKVAGSAEGDVTVREGGVLTYSWGKVGVIPAAKDYSDPIRRVLASTHPNPRRPEIRLPQSILVETDDPITFNCHTHDFMVFGKPEIVNVSEHYRSIQGGEAMIRVDISEGLKKVTGVLIRHNVNREPVAAWLGAELAKIFPENGNQSNADFLMLKEAVVFVAYIAAKVAAGAAPDIEYLDGYYKMELGCNGCLMVTILKGADGATLAIDTVEAYRSGLLKKWARTLGWRSPSKS